LGDIEYRKGQRDEALKDKVRAFTTKKK